MHVFVYLMFDNDMLQVNRLIRKEWFCCWFCFMEKTFAATPGSSARRNVLSLIRAFFEVSSRCTSQMLFRSVEKCLFFETHLLCSEFSSDSWVLSTFYQVSVRGKCCWSFA